MTAEEAVYAECRQAQAEGREITNAAARVIATWWQGPDMPAETARFLATGEISATADYVWRGLWTGAEVEVASHEDQQTMSMLCTYLLNRLDRGPVPGWERLWIR
jgi:hypothetical protein